MIEPDLLRPVFDALKFAAQKHRDQRRKNVEASPYINHPIDLAQLLIDVGRVTDPATLCAAVLHDTIEDTDTTATELENKFGKEVTTIVLEVTDDQTLRKEARKRAQVEGVPHASPKAKLVKLADKICNLRDMAHAPPMGWSLERRREYFDWSLEVVNGLRGSNAALEATFDKAFARRP